MGWNFAIDLLGMGSSFLMNMIMLYLAFVFITEVFVPFAKLSLTTWQQYATVLVMWRMVRF